MRLEETVGVRAMDTLSAIRVTGAESKSWLNGQVTQQLALMKAGDAAYGLAVDVHGKILADLWVLDRGQDELVAIVPKTARDALLTHLDKYIVMEDVDLEPRPRLNRRKPGPRMLPPARTGEKELARDVMTLLMSSARSRLVDDDFPWGVATLGQGASQRASTADMIRDSRRTGHGIRPTRELPPD